MRMMMIQVELRENIDPFDFKSWDVHVPCSDSAPMTLRWLAYASCLRMALNTGDVASKFVPQAVKTLVHFDNIEPQPDFITSIARCGLRGTILMKLATDGTNLDINSNIKDQLQDGSKVIVQCSSGPKAFTDHESEESQREGVACESNLQDGHLDSTLRNANDTSDVSTHILELIDWSSHGIDYSNNAKDFLSPYTGSLQALVIWYSCQGNELEDKDFGVLNLGQFLQIFHDAIGSEITEDFLERVFEQQLKVKEKGSYQLTIFDIFPAIISVASGMPNLLQETAEGSYDVFYKSGILIKDHLIPSLNRKIMAHLQDLQAIPRTKCMEVLTNSRGSLESCLKACQLKNTDAPLSPLKVPFRCLLSFLRKWLVLEKHWNMEVIAVLVIHALHGYKNDAVDFMEVPCDLDFGIEELQEFLLGSAHWCHKYCKSPIQISNEAYFQEYLKLFFINAGVAKPPYSSYDEKKAYLRSMLITKEGGI